MWEALAEQVEIEHELPVSVVKVGAVLRCPDDPVVWLVGDVVGL